jgi:hypothetical protein
VSFAVRGKQAAPPAQASKPAACFPSSDFRECSRNDLTAKVKTLQPSNRASPFHSRANLFAQASAPPDWAEVAARAALFLVRARVASLDGHRAADLPHHLQVVCHRHLRPVVSLLQVAESAQSAQPDGPALAAESKAAEAAALPAAENPHAEAAEERRVGGILGSILAGVHASTGSLYKPCSGSRCCLCPNACPIHSSPTPICC